VKQLLLVRHAKSSWSNPNLEDIERPLNNRGKRDAPYMAAYCRSQNIVVDALVSSPATRAYTTASYFYNEFANENQCFDKETELYFGEFQMPAFFSHNPTITYFTNLFSDEEHFDNVPTCGVIHLISNVENWKDLTYSNTKVKNFYFPKLVREL